MMEAKPAVMAEAGRNRRCRRLPSPGSGARRAEWHRTHGGV